MSINTAEQRAKRREEIRLLAARRGVAVRVSPSGLYHLKGKGVDLKVTDLADVYESDFLPAVVGYP